MALYQNQKPLVKDLYPNHYVLRILDDQLSIYEKFGSNATKKNIP